MKVVVWYGCYDICVEEVFVLECLLVGWVMICVYWCGICGFDLYEYVVGLVFILVDVLYLLIGLKGQCILGYEFSGEIVEFGVGVLGFVVGDCVMVDVCQYCGICWYCWYGLYNICENFVFMGLMNNGVFVEYVNVLVELLYKLFDYFLIEVGVLIELFVVGLYVVKKVGNIVGQIVVVVGVGMIGLCMIMCVKVVGVGCVIVLEMLVVCKQKVLEVGVSVVVDLKMFDVIVEVWVLMGGYGVDVLFECIGYMVIVKFVIDVICKVGKLVMVGIFEELVLFNFFDIVLIEKEVIGLFVYNGEFVDVICFIVDGCIDVQLFIIGCIVFGDIVVYGFEELVNYKDCNVKIIVQLVVF